MSRSVNSGAFAIVKRLGDFEGGVNEPKAVIRAAHFISTFRAKHKRFVLGTRQAGRQLWRVLERAATPPAPRRTLG